MRALGTGNFLLGKIPHRAAGAGKNILLKAKHLLTFAFPFRTAKALRFPFPKSRNPFLAAKGRANPLPKNNFAAGAPIPMHKRHHSCIFAAKAFLTCLLYTSDAADE